MQGIKVMMAWVMLGSVSWAARVTVGDTGFSLEVPKNTTLEKQAVRENFDAYIGETETGLRVSVYTIQNPWNKIATTFFLPLTDGFYRGFLKGLYGQQAAIRFDTQKIIRSSANLLYVYDLIVDYPDGVEAYTRAILSTRNDTTVATLLIVNVFNMDANNINTIEDISNSILWDKVFKQR